MQHLIDEGTLVSERAKNARNKLAIKEHKQHVLSRKIQREAFSCLARGGQLPPGAAKYLLMPPQKKARNPPNLIRKQCEKGLDTVVGVEQDDESSVALVKTRRKVVVAMTPSSIIAFVHAFVFSSICVNPSRQHMIAPKKLSDQKRYGQPSNAPYKDLLKSQDTSPYLLHKNVVLSYASTPHDDHWKSPSAIPSMFGISYYDVKYDVTKYAIRDHIFRYATFPSAETVYNNRFGTLVFKIEQRSSDGSVQSYTICADFPPFLQAMDNHARHVWESGCRTVLMQHLCKIHHDTIHYCTDASCPMSSAGFLLPPWHPACDAFRDHSIIRHGEEIFCPLCQKEVVPTDEEQEKVLEQLRSETRECPACGLRVIRDSGCDHMKCSCGVHWCWACGEERDSTDPYHHNCRIHHDPADHFEVPDWQEGLTPEQIREMIHGEAQPDEDAEQLPEYFDDDSDDD